MSVDISFIFFLMPNLEVINIIQKFSALHYTEWKRMHASDKNIQHWNPFGMEKIRETDYVFHRFFLKLAMLGTIIFRKWFTYFWFYSCTYLYVCILQVWLPAIVLKDLLPELNIMQMKKRDL